jgi:prepilin-type N-terminal cleavage/methylation domain-containing protein
MSLRRLLLRRVVKQGFTLIELLVSVSIMAIILGITFSGGPQSIMRLTLTDNAYQVELMVREAQLQGSAINSFNDIYGGVGIFIDRSTPSQVVKFKDIIDASIQRAIGVGNGLYDTTPTDEKESLFKMSNNHRIGKLCVASSTSPLMCNDSQPIHINTLTVSFNRPKQTAHIYINGTSSVDYTMACIQVDSLKSPAPGFVKSLYVYRSGMITKTSEICR